MSNLILAFIVGLILCVAFMFILLPLLKRLKARQEILHYVKLHEGKKGTSTMGGIAFILAFVVTAVIFLKGNRFLAVVSLIITVSYGVLGFLDDFIKVFFRRNMGLAAWQKALVQLAIASIVAVFAYVNQTVGSELVIPFANISVDVGWLIIPLIILVFISCTNGVNLTDGLDGLAGSTTMVFLILFGWLLYLQEEGIRYADFPEGEYANIIMLCAIMSGALLGFLLFNSFPAKVFMGDTGSMALGAIVACVCVLSRNTFVLPILGVMYVISCLSVIIQVVYFKKTKKRVFLMAPFHHHLQMKGLSEVRIAVIYCTVTLLSGLSMILFVYLR